MKRVKLEMNHPYLGIANEPIEWKIVEKILENTKKFNDAQAQFQGQPGKYISPLQFKPKFSIFNQSSLFVNKVIKKSIDY
jgi:hypothetical protein